MPVDRERLKTRAFERRWARAGGDLCNVIAVDHADDGAGGFNPTESVVEPNAHCIYKARGQTSTVVAGGQTIVLTHDIELKATVATRAIKPHHKILVLARENRSELLFEHLLNQDSSFAPLVKFAASVKV